MSDQWYFSVNGRQNGPMPLDELQRLVAGGGLKPADFVWKEGMSEWASANTVKGLFSPTPPPLPPQSGQSDPLDFLKSSGPVGDVPLPTRTGVSPPINPGKSGDTCIFAYIALGLVCVSMVTGFLLVIPGIVCGHIALNQCNQNPRMKERNYAVAALVAGYIVLGLLVLVVTGCVGMAVLPHFWLRT
jgi:hypothetical protein